MDPPTYISNLSSKTLTAEQNQILTLGLKYVPSTRCKPPAIVEAVSCFKRINRIKPFFRNEPARPQHPFKPKSKWQPPRASTEIEAFLDRIDTDISLLDSIPSYSNLSKDERKALKELALDNSLVINNADKGSCLVVENVDCYIKDGLEHLSDRNVYEQIAEDPTASLGLAINKFIAHIAKKKA